ncbi:MAG: hypothetical protein RR923_02115 [Bacilli bacterium]
MLEQIVSTLRYFFNFFIFFSTFILLVMLLSEIYFKNFKFEKEKTKLYGIFLSLNNTQIISISLILLKFIYLVYILINIKSTYLSLIFILFLSLVFNLLNGRFINAILDIGENIILYLIVTSKDIFINYIINVDIAWYAVLLVIMSIMFGLICITYLFIKDLIFILKQSDYIKNNKDNKDEYKVIIKTKNIKKILKSFKKGVVKDESKIKRNNK